MLYFSVGVSYPNNLLATLFLVTAQRTSELVPKLWITTPSQAKSLLHNLCMFHIYCFRARCTYYSFCSLTRLAFEMIGLFLFPQLLFQARTLYVDIRSFTISEFSLGKCLDLFSGYFLSMIECLAFLYIRELKVLYNFI